MWKGSHLNSPAGVVALSVTQIAEAPQVANKVTQVNKLIWTRRSVKAAKTSMREAVIAATPRGRNATRVQM